MGKQKRVINQFWFITKKRGHTATLNATYIAEI